MTLGFGKVVQVNGEDRDLWIEFEVSHYYAGSAGDYYNPPESTEYEFELVSVEFDPAGDPVPESIRNDIEDWFNTSGEAYNRAYQVAEDYYTDFPPDDRDYDEDQDDNYHEYDDDRFEYDAEDY
jgi:hypothetical protein